MFKSYWGCLIIERRKLLKKEDTLTIYDDDKCNTHISGNSKNLLELIHAVMESIINKRTTNTEIHNGGLAKLFIHNRDQEKKDD